MRYVNANEAHGSISMAIDPAVVASVATIALPVESVAAETTAAAEATAIAAAKLASLDADRPDTTGIDPLLQQFPSAVRNRYPDPSDPERARITQVLERCTKWGRQQAAVWDSFVAAEAEYLPAVNPHIRDRFEGTLPPRDGDPADYHRQFRLRAALLTTAVRNRATAKAPVRTFSKTGEVS